MSLFPEEVRNKEFTTARLRAGYDADEVDAFLDEVEVELDRLIKENDSLRNKLAAASRVATQNQQRHSAGLPVVASDPTPPVRQQIGTPAFPPTVPVSASHSFTPQSPGDGGTVLVLELAGHAADQMVRAARTEAYRIVSEAHSRAESLEYATRYRSEALERDARARCRVLMAPLDSMRAALEGYVDTLQSFEREYRSRLKSHLESQMRRLEVTPSGPPRPAPVGTTPDTVTLPPSSLTSPFHVPWPTR
ncbi:DivIVA domain-containing protein [Streptantibioticus rubrisoli]|uniref:Cell wall synthesis protein Wag31 n=1 Tax=Streptantibioticus rubrisoli TaxID=1387313 RepID=A0ABT1PEK9_9ACTN|nr:DivIVA domain-containing protein [Streptantibioticus rubrisoli]MCQ4043808.1 DivIVA domain-containing protein [Streptantibioticus rubrisoli]